MDVTPFVQQFSIEEMARMLLYRQEWMGMLLDMLSRRSASLVDEVVVFDCTHLGDAHRRLLPFLKEILAGTATQ